MLIQSCLLAQKVVKYQKSLSNQVQKHYFKSYTLLPNYIANANANANDVLCWVTALQRTLYLGYDSSPVFGETDSLGER